MLNSVELMGRLVAVPELRRINSGDAVCSFTLAVDRDYKKDKNTDFVSCIAWRTNAEYLCRYGDKGRVVVVHGRLGSREWTDKEGKKHLSWEVTANNLYFGDFVKKSDKVDELADKFDEIAENDDEELPF